MGLAYIFSAGIFRIPGALLRMGSVAAVVLLVSGQSGAQVSEGLWAPGRAVHQQMGISCTSQTRQAGIIVCRSLVSGAGVVIWQDGRIVSRGRQLAVVGVSRTSGPVVAIEVGSGGSKRWSRKIPISRRHDPKRHIEGFDCDKIDARTAEQKAHASRSWDIKQAAFANFHDPLSERLSFSLPARGRVSSRFGPQRVYRGVSAVTGKACSKTSVHRGLDIAAPIGRQVVAPLSGVVSLAEDDLYYEGGAIFIDHGWGLVSVFMHLSSVEVQVGQRVERGQRLGAIGATGRVTGPHLHWGVKWRRIGDRAGFYIDPEALLDLEQG